jgi:predicted RNA-binding protein with TRAM domain
MVELRKGAELELVVETLSFGGKGLARVNGFVVFIGRFTSGHYSTVQPLWNLRRLSVAKPSL